MVREKVHKGIFENQFSATRGLEVMCQYLISGFIQILKQTIQKPKQDKWASKQASKEKRHF